MHIDLDSLRCIRFPTSLVRLSGYMLARNLLGHPCCRLLLNQYLRGIALLFLPILMVITVQKVALVMVVIGCHRGILLKGRCDDQGRHDWFS